MNEIISVCANNRPNVYEKTKSSMKIVKWMIIYLLFEQVTPPAQRVTMLCVCQSPTGERVKFAVTGVTSAASK